MEPVPPMPRRKGVDQAGETSYADYARDQWPALVRAAVFLGADPHEAEELAQTTLVRCYQAWDKVSAADNRDAYVYRMLLNALRDSRRTRWWRSRSSVEPTDHETVADRSDAVAIADAVHRAMAGLSQVNREAVVLRYFVQLTEAETAQVLGIAPGTVKSRLSRALAALAQDRHLLDIGDPS